jgi:ketosteroid isomerase-like protein
MSQDNINVVRTFFEAAPRGDFATALNALDPEIEWTEPGVPALWFTGTFHGPETVVNTVIAPTAQYVDDFRITIDQYLDSGEHVVALGRDGGRAKATGQDFEFPAAYVCTVRGGKIVRFEAYIDTARWLRALGHLD